MFHVMIADDDETYRRLVRAMLEREDDFQVVAEATDGNEAVELADEVNPDLIIMDVQMPSMDGFEATGTILQRHQDTRVVLVSRTHRRQLKYSRMAQDVGATAFIAKENLSISVLRQALQA